MNLAIPEPATPVREGSRRLLAIVVAIVVILLVGGAAAYVVLTAPPPAKVLVVGTTDDEITFDPADAYDYWSINMVQNTMGMLVTYVPGTTNFTADLLSDVPTVANGGISQDGLNYTLHVRAGLKFEDGTAINATVVKFSLDRVVKLNGQPAFLLAYIKGATEYFNVLPSKNDTRIASAYANYTRDGVNVIDSLTVKITLASRFSPFTGVLAFTVTAPVNPKSFTNDKFYPNVVVASGPYRLSRYLPHQRYELDANPNYYGTQPKMSHVTIIRYTTAVDLNLAMKTGTIDVAYRSLLAADFSAFKTNSAVKVLEGASPTIRYIVFNVCSDANFAAGFCPRAAPFQDARLRQALAYALDRNDISTSAYAGAVVPLYSLIPLGMLGHQDIFKTRYGATPDIAAAQSLLTAAGYSTTNKLLFTFWYTPSHYGDESLFVAQALKRAWEKTNMITVTIDEKEWTQFRVAYRAGQFDVSIRGWFPDYFDSDDYVFPFLHAASGGSASFGNWYKNATMDSLIEQEAASLDPNTRVGLFGQIQQGLAADVPYLPMFQLPQQVVFKPSVSGITLDPIQFFRFFTLSVS